MKKRLLCVMIILSVISAAVFADEDFRESYTNDVTSGIFSEDQDNYLSTTGFGNLESNKLFMSLGSPDESSGAFQIGTANFFDNLYIGTSFYIDELGTQGNSGTDVSITQTSDIDYNKTASGTVTSITTTENEKIESTYKFGNSGQVLVGVGDIGISVYGGMFKSDTTGTYDGYGSIGTSQSIVSKDMDGNVLSDYSKDYDGGYHNDSTIQVSLEVGVPVGSLDIKAGVWTEIVNDEEKYTYKEVRETPNAGFAEYEGTDDVQYYKKETGTSSRFSIDSDSLTDYWANSNDGNYINIIPSVSVDTAFDTPLFGGTTLDVGLAYKLGLMLSPVSEESTSITEYKTNNTADPGYVRTTLVETEEEEADDISYMNHMIYPSFKLTKDFGDSVKLGVSYKPMISIINQEVTDTHSKTVTTTYDDGRAATDDDYVEVVTTSYADETTTTETFKYDYDLGVGAQFMLKERLRINVGAKATVQALTIASEKKDVDGIGEVQTVRYRPDEDGTSYTTTYSESDPDPDPDSDPSTDDGTTPAQTQYNQNLGITMAYEAGFTFFYNDSLTLDMKANMLGTTTNVFAFDTWSAEFTFSY